MNSAVSVSVSERTSRARGLFCCWVLSVVLGLGL